MSARGFFFGVLLGVLAAGCASPPRSLERTSPPTTTQPDTRTMFFPLPITDDWTRWITGEWEGGGEGQAGKGKGTVRFEMALGGQFLIARGESEITGLDPEYLKKHMHATDAEVERFSRAGYHMLEIYTIEQQTGDVLGYLFDSLRCIATGRGKREGFRETVDWTWQNGQKSTRITERVGPDKMRIIERTGNPDGTVMEDKGEMTRRVRH